MFIFFAIKYFCSDLYQVFESHYTVVVNVQPNFETIKIIFFYFNILRDVKPEIPPN